MARLFNAYVIVDWSAASKPGTGTDLIRIGVMKRDVRFRLAFESYALNTRAEAEKRLNLILDDLKKRNELIHQMQKLEYDIGGYIIPFFGDLIDGYAANVKGLKPSKGTLNLDSFGHGFRTIWFS